MNIICPFCKQIISIENNNQILKCPFCNKEIQSSFFNEDESFYDMLNQGKTFLEKEQFDKLFNLSQAMINRWPTNFYSNLYHLCAKTKLDLTKPLAYPSYKLTQIEMQEDIKARLYHFARIKYAKASQSVYDGISSYYPDIPSTVEPSGWSKAKTSFDCRLENIELCLQKVNIIAQHLNDLKKYANDEKENEIIKRIFEWGDYLLKAKKELLRFDDYANSLVKNDFNNTPDPGNSLFAGLYLILFFLSLVLMSITIAEIIIGFVIGDFNQLFSQIGSIFISAYQIAMVVYFTIKLKLFSQGRHPVFASCLYILSIALSCFGITTSFIDIESLNPWVISYFFITLCLLVYTTILACVKWNKYRNKKTRKVNTYIGNYQQLLKNNFAVSFQFEFNEIKKDG